MGVSIALLLGGIVMGVVLELCLFDSSNGR